jgi:hypothetical protein
MDNEIITPDAELIKLVEDGRFFHFCVGIALNKGHINTIREKKEVKFKVGDYDVSFDADKMCFFLTHNKYFARSIGAYMDEVMFIGTSEEEVIKDLLVNAKKELESMI